MDAEAWSHYASLATERYMTTIYPASDRIIFPVFIFKEMNDAGLIFKKSKCDSYAPITQKSTEFMSIFQECLNIAHMTGTRDPNEIITFVRNLPLITQ